MTDYRSVLERDLRRVGPPEFTLADVAGRRERKQRNRRVAAGVVGLGLAALVVIGWSTALVFDRSTPADAPADPGFRGTWKSSDRDGALAFMSIGTRGDGSYQIRVTDNAAAACDGEPATLVGTGTIAGAEMTVSSQVLICADREPLRVDEDLTLTYDVLSDTFRDSLGIVWHRPGGGTSRFPGRFGILGGMVTFEVPEPWFSPWYSGVTESEESIVVGGGPEGTYFTVIEVQAALPPCASSGTPATAAGLAARIQADPNLDATALAPVTIGGVEALRLDVVPAEGAEICRGDRLQKGVPVVMHADFSHPWSVDRGDRMRIHLIPFPGDPARTLAILIVAPSEAFDEVLGAAEPILESFRFATG